MSDSVKGYSSGLSIESLIRQMQLPENFAEIVDTVYRPLADVITDRVMDAPLLVSINGVQGTGKSTMTVFLRQIIEAEKGAAVTALSLDDYYLSRNDRAKLSGKVHPLLKTRGVPGTHEISLLEGVLDALARRETCHAPSFDKAIDDRRQTSALINGEQPADIILFEGWCNNSPVQSEQALTEPVNDLEKEQDKDCVWRRYVNQKLIEYHRRIYDRTDLCVMLKAADFDCSYRWRRLQEEKLRAEERRDASAIMDETQLDYFIQHFERLSRNTLSELPALADVVIPVDRQHKITGMILNT